jgi:hypothetical protein
MKRIERKQDTLTYSVYVLFSFACYQENHALLL